MFCQLYDAESKGRTRKVNIEDKIEWVIREQQRHPCWKELLLKSIEWKTYLFSSSSPGEHSLRRQSLLEVIDVISLSLSPLPQVWSGLLCLLSCSWPCSSCLKPSKMRGARILGSINCLMEPRIQASPSSPHQSPLSWQEGIHLRQYMPPSSCTVQQCFLRTLAYCD